MLNFISFGSGSCGNCYYIYTEEYGILIDIGIGIRKLKKYFHDYGLNIKNVRYVLITHDHADHVKAVGSFSNGLNVPVYATKEVHDGIKGNYCVRKKVDAANIRVIERVRIFILTTLKYPHFMYLTTAVII